LGNCDSFQSEKRMTFSFFLYGFINLSIPFLETHFLRASNLSFFFDLIFPPILHKETFTSLLISISKKKILLILISPLLLQPPETSPLKPLPWNLLFYFPFGTVLFFFPLLFTIDEFSSQTGFYNPRFWESRKFPDYVWQSRRLAEKWVYVSGFRFQVSGGGGDDLLRSREKPLQNWVFFSFLFPFLYYKRKCSRMFQLEREGKIEHF